MMQRSKWKVFLKSEVCFKFVFDIDYRCTLKNVDFLLFMIIVIFRFFSSYYSSLILIRPEFKIGKYDSKGKWGEEVKRGCL